VKCNSTPGFIVNRVARPFYAEAWRAKEDQVAAPQIIDCALREAGGFPMGPLELTDLIGQDVNFAVTCSVYNGFWQDRRFLPSLSQQELVSAGRLGKKSGQGVYNWSEPRPEVKAEAMRTGIAYQVAEIQPGILSLDNVLLMPTNGETATRVAVRQQRPVVVYDISYGDVVVLAAAEINHAEDTDKAISYFQQQGKQVLLVADYPGLLVTRTLAMIINEALDALQKGIATAEDIDIAMQTGVNYPKGPLHWGAELGWQRVLTVLEKLQCHYGEERYRPCSLLRQRALVEGHSINHQETALQENIHV